MTKRWVLAVALTLGCVGMDVLVLGVEKAEPPQSQTKRTKAAAAEAKFRDSFDVDKGTLLDKGSNAYMILEPGYKLVLTNDKDTLTITVLAETKMVDTVRTRVVEERETEGGRLAEVSRNYFAFDKTTGNIYYFGEDVDVYNAQGDVINHEGSWLAGVHDARFGLMMPGQPRVGEHYYQEIAPGVAMDRARILSLTRKVKTPAGTFTNCLRTRESSDLEKGTEEKLYAPGVGLLKDGGFRLAKIEGAAITLPDPVAKTFQTTFPKGEIDKLDVEDEDGVTVYDLEFKDGTAEKETDITADGTMLEFSIVIHADQLPPAVMKTVQMAANGDKIGRIERVEIGYETKDGKAIKLNASVTRYAVEIATGNGTSEIVVAPDGAMVEREEPDGEE